MTFNVSVGVVTSLKKFIHTEKKIKRRKNTLIDCFFFFSPNATTDTLKCYLVLNCFKSLLFIFIFVQSVERFPILLTDKLIHQMG